MDARDITTDQAYPSLRLTEIGAIQIPLPPLEVQREIVQKIEDYQRVIDGARAVIENWSPDLPVTHEWPNKPLAELFQKSDSTIQPMKIESPVFYIGLQDIKSRTGKLNGEIELTDPKELKSAKSVFESGDILFGRLRPNLNKVWLADRPGVCSTDIIVLKQSSNSVLSEYYAHLLRTEPVNNAVVSQVSGAQLPRISWRSLSAIELPVPNLEYQRTVLDEINTELSVVSANARLVDCMEARIRKTVLRVWNHD